MKRFIAAGIGLLAAASVSAGPMGPVDPSERRIGVEFEVASDQRPMAWLGNPGDHSDVKNIAMLGRLSYGVTDRIEIYARLGSTTLDIQDEADAGNAGTARFDGSRQFTYGGGIGAILIGDASRNLAVQANALVHDRHTGRWSGFIAGTVNDYDYHEWQVGLQAQMRFDRFLVASPALGYVGVKYSDAELEENIQNGVVINNSDHEARENIGVYVGLSVALTESWRAYIEGRFLDERSVGGGIRYTY